MKIFTFFFTLLAAVLVSTGCGNGSAGNELRLGEEFTLSTGESAAIKGEDLEITFLEVTEDSRCPRNVTCVWAGRAVSLVQVAIGNDSENIELTEPGLTDTPNQYDYMGYRISFYLLPYPEEPGVIQQSDYRLKLTISKP
jgi:uncharacterized Zn finger protein